MFSFTPYANESQPADRIILCGAVTKRNDRSMAWRTQKNMNNLTVKVPRVLKCKIYVNAIYDLLQ